MRRLTAVWGVACLGESILGITAALMLAPGIAVVVEPILGIGTIAALLAWTRAFQRGRASAPTAAAALATRE
jgi:hypothetical protein